MKKALPCISGRRVVVITQNVDELHKRAGMIKYHL